MTVAASATAIVEAFPVVKSDVLVTPTR